MHHLIQRTAFLGLLLILLLGASCSPEQVPSPTQVNTRTPIPATLAPSQTSPPPRTATFTAMPPTLTATMRSEPVEYRCLEIASSLPPDIEVIGIIVTSGYGEAGETILLDIENGLTQTLPEPDDASLLYFQVSPDRRWLAYFVYSSISGGSQLIIAGADGQPNQIIAWQADWRMISGWLDNENLLISRRNADGTADSLVALNPFSREHIELLPEFPDITDPFIFPINWAISPSVE